LLALMLCAAAARADQYGGFEQYADSGALKPFARDLGGVLGAATFQGGRSLGFSGFDVGIKGGSQFLPEKEDRILRSRGVKAFGLPWVQAEVGMFYSIDGFVRGMSFEGLTIAGGGLRYGILKVSDVPWAPQLLLSGVAHSVVHQHFSASHVGGSLVFSMGTSRFVPYAGVGVDRTRLVVRSSRADPLLNGSMVTTVGSRFTAGMRLKPWKPSGKLGFVYVNVAGILVHGQPGAETGFGVRF
jgi:hypothetical protein